MPESSERRTDKPATIEELADFPFESWHELQEALASGAARLLARGDIARQWAGSVAAPLSTFQRTYHWIMSLTWVWVGAVMCYLAWGRFGWGALWLPLIAFISAMVTRPWMGTNLLTLSAFVAAGAYFLGYSVVAWGAGTWALVGFLSVGWHNWCTARFLAWLRASENSFVRMYDARYVAVALSSGQQFMRDLTEEEIRATAERFRRR